jgi:hypothetical protein
MATMTYAMPGAFSIATIANATPAVMETATHGADDLFRRGSMLIPAPQLSRSDD